MTSPPLRRADTDPGPVRNVHMDVVTKKFDPEIDAALRAESLARAISYADPTGEAAVRTAAEKLAKKLSGDLGRGSGPGANVQVRVSGDLIPQPNGRMRRDKTPLTLDESLTEALFMFLAQVADYEPTERGNGYRASLKKNAPDIVVLFGDKNDAGGPNNPIQKEDH